MNLEGLDCWDDYPMEHGCVCGNDCAPPRLSLDPMPWLFISDQVFGEFRSPVDKGRHDVSGTWWAFDPRPGFSRNKEDYAS